MYDISIPGAWDEPLPNLLGNEPHRLLSLARCLAPRTTKLWSKARLSLVRSGYWRSRGMDGDYSTDRQREIDRRTSALYARIVDHLRLALFSERVVATAIGANGQQVVVPRDRAAEFVFDLERNAIGAPDGAVMWRFVRIRAVTPERVAKADLPQLAVWAKSVVARVDDDGRQLGKAQFEQLCKARFGPKIRRKVLDTTWKIAAPEAWRKRGHGLIPKARRVQDWQAYLNTTAYPIVRA